MTRSAYAGLEMMVTRMLGGRIAMGLAGAAAAFVLTSACSTRSMGSADTQYGAPTSEMAVRSFLDGANVEDYQQMSDLFGTEDGPAVERFGVTDIERRMIVISKLLRHDSYSLSQANLAQLGPDRVRWEARMEGTRKGTVVVPVITVPDGSGRWFVERLNLDAVSASTLP